MPTYSRSPRKFLQRHGRAVTQNRNRPRLNLKQSRAQKIPLDADELDPNVLKRFDTGPHADGGETQPWPPEQQAIPDE